MATDAQIKFFWPQIHELKMHLLPNHEFKVIANRANVKKICASVAKKSILPTSVILHEYDLRSEFRHRSLRLSDIARVADLNSLATIRSELAKQSSNKNSF